MEILTSGVNHMSLSTYVIHVPLNSQIRQFLYHLWQKKLWRKNKDCDDIQS